MSQLTSIRQPTSLVSADDGSDDNSAVAKLHSALLPDLRRLVEDGAHTVSTTTDYLDRNAEVQQVALLKKMARVMEHDVARAGTHTALRTRWQLSDERAQEALAAQPLVDLGKLNDIKAVFTHASGGPVKGMPKDEFIAKAAPILCPDFPHGVSTWYDTVDCDGSGYVNWSKLLSVLQELEAAGLPSASSVGGGGDRRESPQRDDDGEHPEDGEENTSLTSADAAGAGHLSHQMSVSEIAFAASAAASLSRRRRRGGAGSSKLLAEEANRRYCEQPRMSTVPANAAIVRCCLDQQRRQLYAAFEDGSVKTFNMKDATMPIARTVHYSDGQHILDMDLSESRSHLLVATRTGAIFVYDTSGIVATRIGNIIRAFQVTAVSPGDCRTPWSLRKTMPFDPHRMPNARLQGFSRSIDGRLAEIDVPVAFLSQHRPGIRAGEQTLTTAVQATALSSSSTLAHADHLSPIIIGTADGHILLYRDICNGGMLPDDRAIAYAPALSWKPHDGMVTRIEFSVQNAVPILLSASLDGTLAQFDLRHEGVAWKLSVNSRPPTSLGGAAAATTSTPSSPASTNHAHFSHADERPIVGFKYSAEMGVIATLSRSRSVNLWSTHSANRVLTLDAHPVPVVDVCFNPVHGHVITVADDNVLRVWDSKAGKLLQAIRRPPAVMKAAHSGGLSRSVSNLTVDRDTHAVMATTCCPLIYDEELRATKSSAAGTVWPEDYRGHFDAVEFTCHAEDVGVILTSDQRRVAVWDADSGERIAAFLPFSEDRPILGITPVAGREIVLVWSLEAVEMWRYRPARAVRMFVRFAGDEPRPDFQTPRAVLDLPPPPRARRDGMNTAAILTRGTFAIYFPAANIGSSTEAAAMHAVSVGPSAILTPLQHTLDHKHTGTLEGAVAVHDRSAVVLVSSVGDIFFVQLSDPLKGAFVLCCTIMSRVQTPCRLQTFEESAASALTSADVTAARVGRFRPSTGPLWKRALKVAAAERRLGSAPFTRFKHQNQQDLLSTVDFSIAVTDTHMLSFRNDGDALLWSFVDPSARRRADGSWFALHACIPLTHEIGACATDVAFCPITKILAVADTQGHVSLFELHPERLRHPDPTIPPGSLRSLTKAAREASQRLNLSMCGGEVDLGADTLVHAVGSRQYVVPVYAISLLGCFFMCQDTVNSIAALGPTAGPDGKLLPRFVAVTEGTQSLLLRLELNTDDDDATTQPVTSPKSDGSTPQFRVDVGGSDDASSEASERPAYRLRADAALGDRRQPLEPTWTTEHRFTWLLSKHHTESDAQDQDQSPPMLQGVDSTAGWYSSPPPSSKAGGGGGGGGGGARATPRAGAPLPGSFRATPMSAHHLQRTPPGMIPGVQQAVSPPESTLSVGMAAAAAAGNASSATSGSTPKLAIGGSTPGALGISPRATPSATPRSSVAPSTHGSPQQMRPTAHSRSPRSMAAPHIRRRSGPGGGRLSTDGAQQTAPPTVTMTSQRAMGLMLRRPYLQRAASATPGLRTSVMEEIALAADDATGEERQNYQVSSAALEYLQRTLTATDTTGVSRDAATSYRRLVLPGLQSSNGDDSSPATMGDSRLPTSSSQAQPATTGQPRSGALPRRAGTPGPSSTLRAPASSSATAKLRVPAPAGARTAKTKRS